MFGCATYLTEMRFNYRAVTSASLGRLFLLPSIFLFAVGCSLNAPSHSAQATGSRHSAMPATNGIYYSEPMGANVGAHGGKATRQYFRFYEDGAVIHASSTGTPGDLEKWFHRDKSENVGRGSFSCPIDGSINFSITSKAGTVDYAGETQVGTIRIKSHSRINDHRAAYECRFRPDI